MPEDITKEIIKRAKDATPSILEILSSTVGPAVKELAPPICKALTIYGCRNQIAITNAVSALNPLFKEISSRYFELLKETIDISFEIDSKNYEAILSAILQDENASIEAKIELAKEIITAIKTHNRETVKVVITTAGKVIAGTAAISAVAVAGVSLIALEKTKKIVAGKNDRTRFIMDGMVNIAKELNPLHSISDGIKKVSDNTVQMQDNYYKYKAGGYKK